MSDYLRLIVENYSQIVINFAFFPQFYEAKTKKILEITKSKVYLNSKKLMLSKRLILTINPNIGKICVKSFIDLALFLFFVFDIHFIRYI